MVQTKKLLKKKEMEKSINIELESERSESEEPNEEDVAFIDDENPDANDDFVFAARALHEMFA